ncbi:uncharacterized protein BO88DRAFT_446661 [Aspergillus vadensis CBS 113365]|uniref:Uncharacterized protein n=1 Tax=Aspergillus vadensis (strain CBS 113365 / IMI 142717 / IBT 24658) TaxID=1448311 RepID=A0A319AWX2_ASPVC|nr:hypothetical protein BO88DRAFT_446661 [Aspergillus vadensis CBS 113365]PYH64729.1 hypothetical protein BO88DRAFT_446661 [Aspergillus vadensis CBS 113365]
MSPSITSPRPSTPETQHQRLKPSPPPTNILLNHHTLLTTNPEAFIFQAAASLQLRLNPTIPNDSSLIPPPSDTNLIISPYNTPHHLLDLQTLSPASQLLAKALTLFHPIRPDYATAPYTESFNWDSVFGFLRKQAKSEGYTWGKRHENIFYVVVFRSTLTADADGEKLHVLDEMSLREAVAGGGLLKYWFGNVDGERRGLATCVWRSREDARKGGSGPWHRRARGAAREMYERIEFTTLKLLVGEDEEGNWGWEFGEWVDE